MKQGASRSLQFREQIICYPLLNILSRHFKNQRMNHRWKSGWAMLIFLESLCLGDCKSPLSGFGISNPEQQLNQEKRTYTVHKINKIALYKCKKAIFAF